MQELTITGSVEVAAVQVLLATGGKPTNTTHDEIRVFSATGQLMQAMPLPPGTVADNAYVRVDLRQPITIKGRGTIFVGLSSVDGSVNDSITAWTTPSSAVGQLYAIPSVDLNRGSLVQSIAHAHPRGGAICITVLGLGRLGLLAENLLRVAGLVVFLALGAGVWFIRGLKRRWLSIEAALGSKAGPPRAAIAWLYLVLALVWGLAVVLITPPFQAPDEPAHYFRAWSVANLELVAQPGMIVSVPDNVATLPDRLGSSVGGDWAANKYSIKGAEALMWERISATSRDQVTPAAGYAPIGYVPQALGIDVARVLGHSPLLALYLGRLLNLIASAILVFFAIRIVPFGKPFLALVALLPMFVFLTASLSPDALALSGFLLVFAMTLNLSTRSTLCARDIVLLSCAAVLLLNVKLGYVALVFIIFMLRPKQFGTLRRYGVWMSSTLAAAFGLSALVALVAPQMPAGYLASIGMAGVDQARQLAFVARHPFDFAKVLYDTFDQQLLGLDHTRLGIAQMAYGILGWLAIDLPTLGMCAMALAAVLFMGYRGKVSTTPWQRFVILATATVFVCVVSLGLYASWTTVAAPVINGLQGRYFIPAILLGLFAIYGIRPSRERAILLILTVAIGIAGLTTIMALLRFYY